jgi:hypothetical protein
MCGFMQYMHDVVLSATVTITIQVTSLRILDACPRGKWTYLELVDAVV